ncbi:MAG: CarD family transcriptional regulator [Eubacteriales bacterium]|jgi:CarD family transcriptional regulator|nr:CarD family transcriptional regulator [Eubacteriales bacterium]
MFKVGDKVVYPMHGAGIIEAIETKEILGKVKQYYVLRMPIGDMKVMIPVSTVGDAGLRQVIDTEAVQQVLDVLRKKRVASTANWNRRYRAHLEKLKTGDVFAIAEVVRNLTCRDKEKGLSTCERKMLDTARQILVSELALAKDIDQDGAMNLLVKTVE